MVVFKYFIVDIFNILLYYYVSSFLFFTRRFDERKNKIIFGLNAGNENEKGVGGAR